MAEAGSSELARSLHNLSPRHSFSAEEPRLLSSINAVKVLKSMSVLLTALFLLFVIEACGGHWWGVLSWRVEE